MDRTPDAIAKDSSTHSAPRAQPAMDLPTPQHATPNARLASKDFHLAPARNTRTRASWLVGQISGWLAFTIFLVAVSAVLLAIVSALGVLDQRQGNLAAGGLWESIGNIVALILVLVMVTATLLTMADRKWSALMQDRVGPNRARPHRPRPARQGARRPAAHPRRRLQDALQGGLHLRGRGAPQADLQPRAAVRLRARVLPLRGGAGGPRHPHQRRRQARAAPGRPRRLGHPLRLRARLAGGLRHRARGLEQRQQARADGRPARLGAARQLRGDPPPHAWR